MPKPSVTGEVYNQVLLDGIYLAYGWCLITATNGKQIIDWQWCQRENAPAYQAIMNRLPAPMVVVTDGGQALRKLYETLGLTPACNAAFSMLKPTPSPI